MKQFLSHLNKDMKEIKLGTWLIICMLFLYVCASFELVSYLAAIYRLLQKGSL